MIMFVPYGFFISYYVKADNWKHSLCLVFVASIVIEATQLAIGRVFDVDDILLNVIGGMIGFYLYRLVDKIGNIFPKVLKSTIFLDIITVLVFLMFSAYIIWR